MKYLQNRYVNEFFDRTQVKANQHKKFILFIAIIPTVLMNAYIFQINDSIQPPLAILLLIATTAIYFVFVGASILAVDCWIIAEMVSPSILGKYKKLKTFVQIVMNSPTRREVLRVTKLFNDVVEKNGIENYQSTSEFIKNVYDKIENQNRKIESIQQQVNICDENDERVIPHITRQNRNSYDQNLRIKKLEETVQEIKELLENKTPENSISIEEFVRLSERLFKVEEELRNLKGE